ncbi:unnamed protein product [Linum trigynum]|uniref:Uncharacterized protein n=1 Tax=Linum trigynum TaxID=586398 RepID=A0AAV2G3V3_9ROSI
MKQKHSSRLTNFFSLDAFGVGRPPNRPAAAASDVDVREEYANAFRTESYLEFWTRVFTVSEGGGGPVDSTSTAAARLSSYRLFVEHLLDPDQPTVTRVLTSAQIPSSAQSLLAQFFAETADASRACGSLLKDINRVRTRIRTLRSALNQTGSTYPPEKQFRVMLTQLTEFVGSGNPFDRSAPSSTRVRTARANCSELLKPIESIRDRAQTSLRLRSRLKHGSAMFLVALTASLTVIVATHALALLVAAPSLVVATASIELVSTGKLDKVASQLDVAAKGTYILSRDLETISQLVARLSDELEHMHGTVEFWLERGGETWVRAAKGEVWRELKKSECGFSQQLDELEEHLYLCFMTINRARNLVVKEILGPVQPNRSSAPNILTK